MLCVGTIIPLARSPNRLCLNPLERISSYELRIPLSYTFLAQLEGTV